MRAPLRSRVPLVVTIHDVAVLRHPRGLQPLDAQLQRARAARASPGPRTRSSSDRQFSRDEVRRAARRARAEGARDPVRRRAAVRRPDGPRGGRRLRARGLDARADGRTSHRLVEGFRRSGLDGLELRVVGAEGWGDVRSRRRPRPAARGRRRRGARPALPRRRVRRLRLALRGLRAAGARGDGLRHARSSPRPAGPTTSSRTASRSRSTRSTPIRSRRGMQRAVAVAARSRSARGERPTSPGSAPCRRMSTSTGSSPDEAARSRSTPTSSAAAAPATRRYVAALLRELAPIADGERARRGHPPPGARARRESSRSSSRRAARSLRMAARPPARSCGGSALRSRTSSTSSRRRTAGRPSSPSTTSRSSRHPELMAPRDRFIFRTFVPRSARRGRPGARPSPSGRSATSSSTTGIPEEKIVVTPNGVDPIFRPNGPAPRRPAVRALRRRDPAAQGPADRDRGARARRRRPAARPRRRREARRRRAAELPSSGSASSERVELAGHVEHEGLAALYRGAACLVFPSRYEGFGLPVLEAMASGTPVVASGGGRGARGGRRRGRARRARATRKRSPTGSSEALADRDRLVAAGLERATPVHLGRDRPADARRLPGAAVRASPASSSRTGRDPELDRCLAALAPQVDELVVVANPPAPEVDARLIVNDRALGFAANANRGIAATTRPFVVVANPDTEPRAGRRRSSSSSSPRATRAPASSARSSCLLRTAAGSPRAAASRPSRARSSGARRSARSSSPQERQRRPLHARGAARRAGRRPTGCSARSCSCAATMLDELGGFDEGFRLYGEDIDLCYRAGEGGLGALVRPAGLRHARARGGHRPALPHAADALALALDREVCAQAPRTITQHLVVNLTPPWKTNPAAQLERPSPRRRTPSSTPSSRPTRARPTARSSRSSRRPRACSSSAARRATCPRC